MRCGAVWCDVVQCGAVQCGAVQCAVWCTVQCSAVQCSATFQCILCCLHTFRHVKTNQSIILMDFYLFLLVFIGYWFTSYCSTGLGGFCFVAELHRVCHQ